MYKLLKDVVKKKKKKKHGDILSAAALKDRPCNMAKPAEVTMFMEAGEEILKAGDSRSNNKVSTILSTLLGK